MGIWTDWPEDSTIQKDKNRENVFHGRYYIIYETHIINRISCLR